MKLKKLLCGIAVSLSAMLISGFSDKMAEMLKIGEAVVYAETWGDWEYNYSDFTGRWEINKYNGTDTDIVIPDEINGQNISDVRYGTFDDCNTVKSITIPQNIDVDSNAFWGCESLERIDVVDGNVFGLISIDGVLYNYDGREIYSMPPAKTGTYVVPDKVDKIGIWAFSGGNNLTNIEVSPDNKYYYAENGVLFSKFSEWIKLELFPGKRSGTYVIPDEVASIADYAFCGCEGLTDIVISSSVTHIGDSAFSDCVNLNNIILPDTVKHIYPWAFDDCKKFTTITIPNGVDTLYRYTFNGCDNLTAVSIPASVSYIDFTAFAGCNNLERVDVSEDNPDYYSIDGMVFDREQNNLLFTPKKFSHVHTIQNTIKKATFSEDGELIETCAVCKQVISTNVIPKISSAVLSVTSYEYDGKAKRASVIVKDSKGNILSSPTDYYLTYAGAKINIGEYTIKVTFKGNYSGTKSLSYKIVPAKVASLKQSSAYSSAKIKMSWGRVSGADGYCIYRAASKNGTYKLIQTTTTNSGTNTDLKSGSKYYYKVRAYKTVNGKKIYGAYSEAKSMITKPEIPGVAVSPQKGSAKITWTKSKGANGYEIYMATSRNGSYKVIKSANSLAKNYTKYGLKKGQRYYFKVRAYKLNGSGEKVYSGYSTIKSVTVK